MAQFYTLLTEIGEAKLANAIALQEPIEITQLAVGDGGGTLPEPQGDEEQLINEVRRAAINTSHTDPDNPSWIVVEQVIPPDVGGWTIREVGIFDSAGDLVAYGNYPETYKPVLEEGSSRTQTVRFVLEVSDTAAVTLKVDPSVVLATRAYVDTERAAHEAGRAHPAATTDAQGMVELATQGETDTGTDAARAVTPATLAGRTATELRTGLAEIATQAETDAGTDDARIVTPKKLKNWTKQATEAVLGLLKVATQAQVDAGDDDTTTVTPKKLRWGVSYSISTNGHLALPSWLGGLILQWGEYSRQAVSGNSSDSVTFSTSFPNAAYYIGITYESSDPSGRSVSYTGLTQSGFDAVTYSDTANANTIKWIAVGN